MMPTATRTAFRLAGWLSVCLYGRVQTPATSMAAAWCAASGSSDFSAAFLHGPCFAAVTDPHGFCLDGWCFERGCVCVTRR
ncbi:uncharacterized protein IWZ02DRAFT_85647 [Phyllosticta citriasiana]|uniref:uncharacterized protein n=1 Tax=Phyllosticta citriasiana TaxID=595635 RepID=UPI0030FDBF29